MNQKVLYSVMGLAAMPMVQTVAQTQNWTGTTLTVAKSGAVSDGSAEAPQEPLSFNIGKLVPGNYNLAFNLTSKVYDVTVAVANAKAEAKQDCNNPGTTAQGVNIPFVVEDATKDIVISLTSSDPSESGSGYSYTALEVNLSFDFATVKTTLTSNAQTLATTISGYNYAAKDEDVKAANALKTKASNVATSYDDYKKFKLYADPNTIQEEIDALAASAAAKEAAYQNEQAYNRVNAAITAIKAKYNAAVAKLEVKLVGAAAYLLDGAKTDLNENINQEITTATSASYASYQAGTAVADEATNTAKVPTEDALNAIVDNWEGQAQQNKDAYAALVNVVTTLQANLNAITYNDNTIKAAYAEDSQAIVDAIAAINTTVTGVYNDAAQLTTSVETARAAAQAKIETLAGKVNTANAEFDANKATVAAIAAVQKKLDDAKTAVGAKKSKDTTYPGSTDYYADLVKGIQDEINALSTAAATAYKVDGTGTAQTYNAALSTAAIETEIADYQTNAIAAVEKYDALQDAINGTEDQTGYQDSLDIARDKVKDLKVYIDDTYDYKTKFDLIQKRINDIKKAITAAQAKTGEEHWTAMLVIDADAAIIDDITTLLNNVQTDQNEYDMALLANGLTDIETRIAAINTAADADAYGEDKDSWKAAQQRIADKYTAIKTAKEAVDPEDADAAATIVDLGKQITALQAEQTDLETAAAEVAAKVTANNNLKSTLNTNITNLQTKIGTFKTTYKIGGDDSTLGNRGKADGSVTKEVGEIETALGTLKGENDAVTTTGVKKVVKTVAASGLDKGVYDVKVEVVATAAGTATVNGSEKAYATGTDTYILENVFVFDGTLKAAVSGKEDKVTVKELTYHENSLDATYNNSDVENLGLNNTYTALNAQENALETAAPGIKKAVENNAATNTAAIQAVSDLQTAELNTLKSLENVTDANAVSDAAAKKANPADFNFKVFETGLAADKSYTAKKAAIDADIAAMSAAIAASNAEETLASKWTNNSITVGEGNNAKTYSIAAITSAINSLKNEAADESANWKAYEALQNNNMSQLQPDTIFKDMTDAQITELCGVDAKAHYTGLKTQYINAKATILNNMQTSLYNRKAVADKDGFVTEINAVIAKVQVVKSDAQANLAKYTEQKAAYTETQTLWNDVYTTIAATDKSSEAQNYLDQLDEIQVELTAATNKVEESYPVGQSVANVQDFAAIKAKINTVKQTQKDTYAVWIAADNAAAHESFKTAIDQATKAYQTAVADRAQYSSTNEDVKDVIDALAAKLDEAIFNAPTQIANLTAEEDEAYVANSALEDPTPFDVSQFNADALAIEQNITAALNTFKDGVQGALNDFWTPTKNEINAAVAAAEAAIADYNADAKADAFKDVKDLVAKGNAGVASMILSEVEDACKGLKNYEDMIDADKEAAAAKDITIANEAATKAYNDAKTYINGKTIADDVNNVKATQLQNLEDAYADATEALEDKPTFANHNAIRAALDNVVAVAAAAKAAVDTAIANDVANTAAYNDVTAAITPMETKLADAKEAAAPYKYATSFDTDEEWLSDIKEWAADSKSNGNAVANKAGLLNEVANLSADIELTLTTAFGTEKAGLAGDITELKNQFNAYVGANGLNETAKAFNTDIKALETELDAADIADLDDPADGIDFDDIVAATDKLVDLQGRIADKETELLKANASTANAEVLADFQLQIAELEKTASLEGYDAWVGQQAYGNTTLDAAINDLKAQLAEVKAEIEAEENISFYKDQYQEKIDAIKADLVPVSEAIAAKQAKFAANAAAYERLTVEIAELQAAVDAAVTKVREYEYAANEYYWSYIYQTDQNDDLVAGVQWFINNAKAQVETDNANKALTANSVVADKDYIVSQTQTYLDRSAYYEINQQRANLNIRLTNAIDAKYEEQKYSSELWARLQDEKAAIYNKIVELAKSIYYSNQTYEGSFDVVTDYGVYTYIGTGYATYYRQRDENSNWIRRTITCDADLAGQLETVKTIKAEIETLSIAVDNLALLGDANTDGKVNVLDYQKVLNMILDPTLQPEEGTDLFANIDINQSKVVEVGDLTAIVNYILEGDWQGYAAVKAFGQANESLTMDITQVQQGVQRYAINLQNVEDYTAFQLDVVLPEGMTIVGSSLSERAGQSHKLYSRAQQDGSIRLLASSVKGDTFSGNEGAVLYIDVQTDANFKGGSVEMLNILFSDVNAQTRAFAIGNGGEATGIDIMAAMQSLKQKVYDLGGRVMNGMRKGVNIIQNADGTTKKVLK